MLHSHRSNNSLSFAKAASTCLSTLTVGGLCYDRHARALPDP